MMRNMRDALPLERRPTQPAGAAEADFESFYLEHKVRLFRALVVVTRDLPAAEDVAQTAFVRIWERWDRVGRMADPAGYLYRTALNEWFQLRRRAVRSAGRLVMRRRAIDPLELVEDRDELSRRLLDLPARQRAALVLTDYLGYDSAEGGRVLGIRPGTVRRLASKARATLRRAHEEGEDDERRA
jgi:RNA polymerase sigma factor (sigma-70 family)